MVGAAARDPEPWITLRNPPRNPDCASACDANMINAAGTMKRMCLKFIVTLLKNGVFETRNLSVKFLASAASCCGH